MGTQLKNELDEHLDMTWQSRESVKSQLEAKNLHS